MVYRKIFVALSMIFGLLAVAFILFLAGFANGGMSVAHANANGTHYVSPGGECGQANPCYGSIQAAVDAATNGDLIKVAQGQYTSVLSQVVYIDKGVTLVGGYNITDWDNSNPAKQSTIIDAEKQDRRGVYIEGHGAPTITLKGLVIQNADPLETDGAGIYILNGTVVLEQNLLVNNHTDLGGTAGGGLKVEYGTIVLTGNTFQNNNAAGGGGIAIGNGVVTMHNNHLLNNGAFFGGGLNIGGGTVSMNGNILRGNTGGSDQGPGILVEGGSLDGENDIIADNGDDIAGEAVSVWDGTLTARHWTLVNNGGYAVKTSGGSAVLTNTLVASHTVSGFSGEGVDANTTLFYDVGSTCSDGASCTNNLSGNPMFVNPTEGDYHIQAGSAAIDQGLNAGVITDIDGTPRPVGSGYDIGADEFGYWIYLPLVVRNE